ncbi:uncharacterized protein PITG_19956 [Phytophthora infestans T30-4]|uniref:Uncharacterized protein n=1 Tax=Phytophthora infestans (strain T30-4) TaxID=403677 RepID=D0P289_PHYIT|nr:uncharacterized protein PITG_19956 [Phytophthora infestans T30-4]EEY55840.1 conserved hypothetical protein [Phytophthora infestans T30-4]|eukprot:XP_002895588.1 conserved hypothetical protein [Phytophthora infestans T30-4]
MQMQRFVLWAMLDADRQQTMAQFYQSEVVGKFNLLRIHEADPLNFLLRMECTVKVTDGQENGLRARVETLLNTMEQLYLHTSYSSTHALVRLILHPVGKIIIGYVQRFQYALALDPKRLSIAVSAAAAAGQHDAAKLLLQHGSTQRVPIDAGSFAHAVESAPDDVSRLKVADLYMNAKENGLVYITQGTDSSIVNYLLQHAILDGNFKHMMELMHEMQLYGNMASNRTKKMPECPTIMELIDRFPNVIPRSVHSFSQGVLYSLFSGDLGVALDLMRAALRNKAVTLRPEIYSQLLYPLLAGGQRGGDESSDASVFDRLEVERCFDRQYPRQRTHLNSLVVNICQSNDDFSTMLVCLDRWQAQDHPPMSRRVMKRVFDVIWKQIRQLQKEHDEILPGTAFIVDGMELSYWPFLVRYSRIVTWDAWTLEYAIVRARTSGLHADVVAILAEADSRGLVLNSTAYIVSLCVLEEVGEPSAVVAS